MLQITPKAGSISKTTENQVNLAAVKQFRCCFFNFSSKPLNMKSTLTLAFFFAMTASMFAQQTNKWMKDKKNILTITITKDATKAELIDLKDKLWDAYQIKFECPEMEYQKNNKKLKYLSLRVEMPTGEVGTVGTSFIARGQVIGFHWDRNPDTYDEFGVWTKWRVRGMGGVKGVRE